jgi:hypothetical protein
MAFNPNIPQPSDTLSQSQMDILANFQAIAPLFDQGIQPFVILPEQGSAPATAIDEIALYSKDVSGTPQLFMRQQSNGAEFNFTSSSGGDNGWSYLPSGLLIKWGGAAINSTGASINFQAISGGPVYTTVFRSFLTPNDTGTATNFTVGIRSPGTTTTIVIYANNPSSTTGLRYFIIGV